MVFAETHSPRVFGLPIGVNFPEAVVDGLLSRCIGHPPEYIAKIELYVSTRRMQRRVREVFDSRHALLLPKIKLISEIGSMQTQSAIPAAAPKLRLHLELAKMISKLVELQPELSPKSAIFDLAESLGDLMAEMHGEGVSADIINNLDVTDVSGHWRRALDFVKLIKQYNDQLENSEPSTDGRYRRVVELLLQEWSSAPPETPIIIAGSTGSRGATHLLMSAVAQLPQGAVIIPGFDFDLPNNVWVKMRDTLENSDHPQFRYVSIMDTLSIEPKKVSLWHDTPVFSKSRNALVSLSMRPAPITDQWISEGPKLENLHDATKNLSLLEAPSTRLEALAIAIKLRECVELGIKAALVTPDRVLTRKVAAALDQWGIVPDDSAGLPLVLSAPGRFILHTVDLFDQTLTLEALLALLKHPIASSGKGARGNHLRWTRDFELHARRKGIPFPTSQTFMEWAVTGKNDGRIEWARWLGDLVCGLNSQETLSLETMLTNHLTLMNCLSSGYKENSKGILWDAATGEAAKTAMDSLIKESEGADKFSSFEYKNLIRHVLKNGEVHNPIIAHPNIMIWGTLEARVQGADLVILAGLNEGIWPKAPEPDPWMNRKMRHSAGLLLPERQIGLSAHDFQQAIGSKEVILSRSIRNADTPTVPSRWVLRLTNLLDGLQPQGGDRALQEMRGRGNALLALAGAIENVSEFSSPALRPSPCPPVISRPKRLSVTAIKKLIRDPYEIYAKTILRLNKLDPIRQTPDARLSGLIIHKVFEKFIPEHKIDDAGAKQKLRTIAEQVIQQDVFWPLNRRILLAKIENVSDWFIKTEAIRQTFSASIMTETKGGIEIGKTGVTLIAKADRIDISNQETAFVYDYKTGAPPSKLEQLYFDKQLLLTAGMVERGAFDRCPPIPVSGAEYIGLGSKPSIVPAPLNETSADQTWAELENLVGKYLSDDQGFTSRRAMNKQRISGDFDHLARYGEWENSDTAKCEKLK